MTHHDNLAAVTDHPHTATGAETIVVVTDTEAEVAREFRKVLVYNPETESFDDTGRVAPEVKEGAVCRIAKSRGVRFPIGTRDGVTVRWHYDDARLQTVFVTRLATEDEKLRELQERRAMLAGTAREFKETGIAARAEDDIRKIDEEIAEITGVETNNE